jgi:hypothetical protein
VFFIIHDFVVGWKKENFRGINICADLLRIGKEMALTRQVHVSFCYSAQYLKEYEIMLEIRHVNILKEQPNSSKK